jgi:hypothetical protein
MQALTKRFVRVRSGVTYGLIAAPLMLIGVVAWVVATNSGVAATQINQLGIMANANNAPTSP